MAKSRVFQLIDLDRTIFDTSRFVKLITDEIDTTHPGVGTELDERFEAAYKNEETFFLLRHLRELLGDEPFEQLVERIVLREGVDSLLKPGTKERLLFANEISSLQPAWGILTYGDEIDQTMKLRLLGLQDIPTLILPTPNKGEIIKTWQNEDGTFTLPDVFGGHVVDHLSLEDDKLRAFIGKPDGVHGLWMVNPQNSQHLSEDVLAGVTPINDFYESINYLEKHL